MTKLANSLKTVLPYLQLSSFTYSYLSTCFGHEGIEANHYLWIINYAVILISLVYFPSRSTSKFYQNLQKTIHRKESSSIIKDFNRVHVHYKIFCPQLKRYLFKKVTANILYSLSNPLYPHRALVNNIFVQSLFLTLTQYNVWERIFVYFMIIWWTHGAMDGFITSSWW